MKNYNAECLIARYQERPISIGKIANYKNEIQAPRKIVTDKRDNSRVITVIDISKFARKIYSALR